MDEEKKRFLLSLNPSEVTMSESPNELCQAVTGHGLLNSLLEERTTMFSEISNLPGIELAERY